MGDTTAPQLTIEVAMIPVLLGGGIPLLATPAQWARLELAFSP
jgi:hypothetical protein